MPATTKTEEQPEVVKRTNVVTSNGRPVAVVAPGDYVQSNYNEVLDYARNVLDKEEGLAIRSSGEAGGVSRVLFAADEELAIKIDAVQLER